MRRSIAIVDPDAAALGTLRTILNSLDVDVQVYASAEEYLSRVTDARTESIACLITETALPGMSGLQLLQRIRQEDRDLPVLLLASDADVPMAVEAMRQGATDFIERPQWDVALLRRVSEVLRSGHFAATH